MTVRMVPQVMYLYPSKTSTNLLQRGHSIWDAARLANRRFHLSRFLYAKEVHIVDDDNVIVQVVVPTGITMRDGVPLMEGEQQDSELLGTKSARSRTGHYTVAYSDVTA